MKTLVIATKNEGKLTEYKSLLRDFKLNIVSLRGFQDIRISETGKTFDENALLKAKGAAEATGYAAMGDDSGLEVAVLGNRPGIYTARYAGPQASDSDNIRKLLKDLSGVLIEERGARFVCSLALVLPDRRCYLERGFLKGIIAFEPKGMNGFGYDPIFYLPEYKKTLAEIPEEQKNVISHRASAVSNIKKYLNLLIQED